MEENSTGGQGLRRAVAPSDDADDGCLTALSRHWKVNLIYQRITLKMLMQSSVTVCIVVLATWLLFLGALSQVTKRILFSDSSKPVTFLHLKFAVVERHEGEAWGFNRDGDVEMYFPLTPYIYSCGGCGHAQEDTGNSLLLSTCRNLLEPFQNVGGPRLGTATRHYPPVSSATSSDWKFCQ